MEIFDTLDAFNIAEKLFCITMDNASNNKKVMKCLSKLLLKWKGIRWKWQECHISCLNHVIDLAVQAFLKSIKVIEDSKTEEEEEEEEDEWEDIDEEDEDEVMEEEDEDEDLSLPQVMAGASEFQAIMYKLHEIVKVSFLSLQIFSISKLISTSRKQNPACNERKHFMIFAQSMESNLSKWYKMWLLNGALLMICLNEQYICVNLLMLLSKIYITQLSSYLTLSGFR